MLTGPDILPLLVEACPSYRERWARLVRESYEPGEERLIYVELGDFARHVLECQMAGSVSELGAVFAVVERFHTEGDSFVRQAVTIGLLEALQNIAGHRGIDQDLFMPWPGPESIRWWRGLQRFWLGESSMVQPVDLWRYWGRECLRRRRSRRRENPVTVRGRQETPRSTPVEMNAFARCGSATRR